MHSALSCFLRRRFPLFRYHTRYTGVPERSLGFARDDVTEMAFSKYIRCTLREINPFPPPSFRAQREIFLALHFFLLPSQKISPFPLSHIGRYTSVPERSLDFARDDVAEAAFSQHPLYTERGLSIPHTVISSKVEKSSLHFAFFCFLRRRIPIFRCLTYGAIPVCKKDPSTSLGMTLRKWRFPNISFIRDVGYPSPIPSFLAKSRNIPRTLLFLAPFAKVFPFSAITHTTLSPSARKIPRLRSG